MYIHELIENSPFERFKVSPDIVRVVLSAVTGFSITSLYPLKKGNLLNKYIPITSKAIIKINLLRPLTPFVNNK